MLFWIFFYLNSLSASRQYTLKRSACNQKIVLEFSHPVIQFSHSSVKALRTELYKFSIQQSLLFPDFHVEEMGILCCLGLQHTLIGLCSRIPFQGNIEVSYVLQSIFMAIKQLGWLFLLHQKSNLCLLIYILLSLQMDGYKKLSLLNGKRTKELLFIKPLKDTLTSFDRTELWILPAHPSFPMSAILRRLLFSRGHEKIMSSMVIYFQVSLTFGRVIITIPTPYKLLSSQCY